MTGLLSAPAARIEKLAGSLDARGNRHLYTLLIETIALINVIQIYGPSFQATKSGTII